MSTTNWDKLFAEAHLNSWPTAGISIQTTLVKSNMGAVLGRQRNMVMK